MITLTKEMVRSARTPRGGYTAKQIKMIKDRLGVGPGKAVGKVVPKEWYDQLCALSGKGQKQTPKSAKSRAERADKAEYVARNTESLFVLVVANTLIKVRRDLIADYERQFCRSVSSQSYKPTFKQWSYAKGLSEKYQIEKEVRDILASYAEAGYAIANGTN